jgi:hypothetical protein
LRFSQVDFIFMQARVAIYQDEEMEQRNIQLIG